jgi:hypothetical protein
MQAIRFKIEVSRLLESHGGGMKGTESSVETDELNVDKASEPR